MKVRKMLNTTIQRAMKANEYNGSVRGYVARALLSAAYITPLAGLAALVAGGTACDGGGEDPVPPTADLIATPADGAKPLDVSLDASASTPGNGRITRYGFDFDGDGLEDYAEDESNAPDGTFDGQTTAPYPDAGDFVPSVTVEGTTGSDLAEAPPVGVGYGGDEPGLIDYVNALLTAEGYTCTLDQDFQLFNPSTGLMTAYTGLKAELSAEIIYVPDNWASLTAEQLATLTARENEGIVDPEVVVPSPDDSPDDVNALFGLPENPKSAGKSADPDGDLVF